MNKFLSLSLLLLSLLFLSAGLKAEQKHTKGNWDIHYIAFPSSFIQPQVAKNYKLQRSKYKAVVNISVLDNQNKMEAQNAFVTGTARTLLGQIVKLKFVKVKEGPAIYYLAQLDYVDQEIYNFDVQVQQGNRTEQIKFQQKFYVDQQ